MKASAVRRVGMGAEREEGIRSLGVFFHFVKIMVQLLWAEAGPVELSSVVY